MPGGLDEVFAALKPLFSRYAERGVVLHDQPGKYDLGSHEARAKDGYRTWLGGVEIKKNYVSVHLMPVYADPTLLDSISQALRKRMQGKSCFNFTSIEPQLFEEMGQLIDTGVKAFEKAGKFKPQPNLEGRA